MRRRMLSLYLKQMHMIKKKKRKKEKKEKEKREKKGHSRYTRTISPTPPVIEISTLGKSLWDPIPPPLLPLDGFCLEERCHNPSSPSGVFTLLYGVLIPVHRQLPLMKFGSRPYPTLPLHLA